MKTERAMLVKACPYGKLSAMRGQISASDFVGLGRGSRLQSPSVLKSSAARRLQPFIVTLSLMAVLNCGCSKTGDSKEVLLSRANDYFAADQYNKAEKEYREVLRLAPTDPVALGQLGILYHEQGQIQQAYPLLKKAAELKPDDREVQLKFGLTLLALRQFAEARDAALQVLDKEPGQDQALILLADTAVAPASDIDETRKLIKSRQAQDQDRPGYHLALGTLDVRQKEKARAQDEFKKALELDPKVATTHTALGLLYWARNDLKAADQEFKTAADLVPWRSPNRLRYADFLLKTGSADAGKAMLEEINRKIPDYLPPRVLLMRIACAKAQDEDCATRAQNILAQEFVQLRRVVSGRGSQPRQGQHRPSDS